jgi:hypothetical protein
MERKRASRTDEDLEELNLLKDVVVAVDEAASLIKV